MSLARKIAMMLSQVGADTSMSPPGAFNEAQPVTIASTATVAIGAAASNNVTVTGTTTITAFDTIAAGAVRRLTFSGALTLTHNATSLILPGATNVVTAAGDVFEFVSLGGGNWRCVGRVPVPMKSMVRLNVGNGYGSTNTMIRRFTNTLTNQGADITYADSATLGASFTINTAGVYSVSYSDAFTGNSYTGLSLNTTQPTTNIAALSNAAEVLGIAWNSATAPASVSWTGYLAAGSVIRPHCMASTQQTGVNGCNFTITRVA